MPRMTWRPAGLFDRLKDGASPCVWLAPPCQYESSRLRWRGRGSSRCQAVSLTGWWAATPWCWWLRPRGAPVYRPR